MSIKIIRKTGFMGMAVRLAVKVNGEKIAKISHQESLQLNIKEKEALLRVSQLGTISNEIKVNDGDVIEVKMSNWSYLFVFLLVFNILLSSLNIHSGYQIAVMAIVVILWLLTLFVLNGFRLRKINE
ncbi:hypothetical protein QNK01_09475 [Desemzia incerta]|uniref:hypothetical protein n=1 Tax=Desemzia incerta TaxID=82801 RepID=UPI0024C3144D|nr:hypothetical protein [Desemzia incerta]WHZ31699.1 hypothetical protein QNK01_09475 [Desemzia incerta]